MRYLCLFFSLFFAAPRLHAQYYPYPFDLPVFKLKEIPTKHFRIIFSENSREEALRLSSFIEEEYENLQTFYGPFTNIGGPIRVVLSKDTHNVNGVASPVPIPTIQLYLARPPESYSSIAHQGPDPLRTMFRHELTHIFTLSLVAKGMPRMDYTFGNILYPNPFFASRSLIEGASVMRESAGGYGRLNDPYTLHLLRRDFYHKGRLRTPDRVSGADRSFDAGHLPYTYGGLFYSYLNQNFTPKFDRQIWENTSRLKVSVNAVTDAVMDNTNQRKRTFASLWKEFEGYQKGMLPPLDEAAPLLSSAKRRIHSLSLREGRLYYYDAYRKELRCIRLSDGRNSLVFYGSSTWEKLHISSDESLVLVSGFAPKKSLLKTYTAVLNLKTGRIVQKPAYGLTDASFAPYASLSNIAYTAVRLGKTNTLVYRENNKEFTLLSSSPDFYFDSPVMYRSHIYFVSFYKGKRRLMRMLADGTSKETLDIPHVRFPVESSDSLSFAYTENASGLYKTAFITGNTLCLVKNNLKGEMLRAVIKGSTVYAQGSFGDSDNISALQNPQLEISPLNFKPFTKEPPVKESPLLPLNVKRYQQSKDIAPRFWLPYASLTEAGVMFKMFDPPGADTIGLIFALDYFRAVPQFQFDWLHSSLPVNFNFFLKNIYIHQAAKKNHLVAAGFQATLPLQSALNGSGFFALGLSWQGRFTGPEELHPYQWNSLSLQQLVFGALFTWEQRVSEGRPYFQRLAGLTIRASVDALNPHLWRVESSLRFSPPLLPVFWNIYGVYDSSGALPSGSTFLGSSLIPRYQEYADLTKPSPWAVFSSLDILLIPGEINRGVDMGELFLQSINLLGGYRIGYWSAQGLLHSAYLRLDISLSLFYGNLSVVFSQEGAYAVSRNSFSYNFNLGLSLPF